MGNLTEQQSQSSSPNAPAGYQNFFKELRGQGLFSPYTSQGASGLGSILGDTATGLSGLGSFIGSPGTPSVATQAQLKEFGDITAPELLGQSVLMGQGNSGAALSALAQGQEQAAVPLLQQDLSNSLNASSDVANLGSNAAGQLAQLGQGRESYIGSLISQFIGQNQKGKVTSQQPKF